MKKLLLLLGLIFTLLVGTSFGQPMISPPIAGAGFISYTVATLPGSPTIGDTAYVTNGISAADCTVGGGSSKVPCIFNGSSWITLSTGGMVYPAMGITTSDGFGWTTPIAYGTINSGTWCGISVEGVFQCTDTTAYQPLLTRPVTGPASPVTNNLVKFTGTGEGVDNAGVILGTMTNGYYCTYTTTGTLLSCNTQYPTAGGLIFTSDAQDDIAVRGATVYERLNITEQTLVGRITGGHVAPLSTSQIKTLLGYPTSGEYQTVLTNSAGLAAALTDETGTGYAVFNTSPDLLHPIIHTYTVSTLPGTPSAGWVAVVTDGATATDCTTGSGSTIVLCRYTGSAWASLGGGAGGGTILGSLAASANYLVATEGTANTVKITVTSIDATTGVITTPQQTTPDSLLLRPGSGATNPTYYRGWMGPAQPVTGYTIYQLPDADPTAGQIMFFGAVSSHVSAVTWGLANSGLLTGFSSGAGTVAATDTMLVGFNKLDGNIAAKMTNPMSASADMIVGGTSGTPARLAKGAANSLLGMNSDASAEEFKTSLTGLTFGGFGVSKVICSTAGGVLTDCTNLTDLAFSSYAALAGATFTGKVNTLLSGTGGAGFNLPHGEAPSSPTNGDLWTTSAGGLYVRINGATVGPLGTGGGGNVSNSGTPTIHQWSIWTDATTIKGVTVTGSKVACTDSNGEPTPCTNLTDLAFSSYLPLSGGTMTGQLTTKGVTETIIAGGTCSTSYNVNPSNGTMITLILDGACTIGVTSLVAGESFTIFLTQSSTTAPTFSSAYKWASGTAPSWSTSATKYDTVACASPDGTKLICGAIIDGR